ncbi:MAG: hypothetical protein QOE37_487 [Microbacteriaceae bacterium]|jgi:sporulation protein YlmC with PRC-barrel domain|nr:hypothetical protein [Microbacteriaceae bacterium]
MILGDLIGLPVRRADGTKVGTLADVRLVAADAGYEVLGDTRVFGVLVSPHSRGTQLGYERTGLRAPAPIAAFARWHQRGMFLVRWQDIAAIASDGVTLREGHRRFSPELPR